MMFPSQTMSQDARSIFLFEAMKRRHAKCQVKRADTHNKSAVEAYNNNKKERIVSRVVHK